MKTICIFHKGNYIEDYKVHHSWSDEVIEQKVLSWCVENVYEPEEVEWSFEKEES